ncbi:hypothetical protein Q7P37_007573 [Cladosporium fusiforme]
MSSWAPRNKRKREDDSSGAESSGHSSGQTSSAVSFDNPLDLEDYQKIPRGAEHREERHQARIDARAANLARVRASTALDPPARRSPRPSSSRSPASNASARRSPRPSSNRSSPSNRPAQSSPKPSSSRDSSGNPPFYRRPPPRRRPRTPLRSTPPPLDSELLDYEDYEDSAGQTNPAPVANQQESESRQATPAHREAEEIEDNADEDGELEEDQFGIPDDDEEESGDENPYGAFGGEEDREGLRALGFYGQSDEAGDEQEDEDEYDPNDPCREVRRERDNLKQQLQAELFRNHEQMQALNQALNEANARADRLQRELRNLEDAVTFAWGSELEDSSAPATPTPARRRTPTGYTDSSSPSGKLSGSRFNGARRTPSRTSNRSARSGAQLNSSPPARSQPPSGSNSSRSNRQPTPAVSSSGSSGSAPDPSPTVRSAPAPQPQPTRRMNTRSQVAAGNRRAPAALWSAQLQGAPPAVRGGRGALTRGADVKKPAQRGGKGGRGGRGGRGKGKGRK